MYIFSKHLLVSYWFYFSKRMSSGMEESERPKWAQQVKTQFLHKNKMKENGVLAKITRPGPVSPPPRLTHSRPATSRTPRDPPSKWNVILFLFKRNCFYLSSREMCFCFLKGNLFLFLFKINVYFLFCFLLWICFKICLKNITSVIHFVSSL